MPCSLSLHAAHALPFNTDLRGKFMNIDNSMKVFLLTLAVFVALVVALLVQPFAPVPVVLGALFTGAFAAIISFALLLCVGTLAVLMNPIKRIEFYLVTAVLL